jgi:hypothetical protein
MKRLPLTLCALLTLSACSTIKGWWPHQEPPAPAPKVAPAPTVGSDGQPLVNIDGVPIERVEFKPGVSSATVEKMAHQGACTGGIGAGLVTPAGPVEVYRMTCDDGRVFMARCELRQCKKM